MNWMGISKDKKRNIFYILPPFMQTPEQYHLKSQQCCTNPRMGLSLLKIFPPFPSKAENSCKGLELVLAQLDTGPWLVWPICAKRSIRLQEKERQNETCSISCKFLPALLFCLSYSFIFLGTKKQTMLLHSFFFLIIRKSGQHLQEYGLVTRFAPDSTFLGIVLGYGAALIGYIYYGVPVGADNQQAGPGQTLRYLAS